MLAKKIDYKFKNPELLQAALTHRSIPGTNNERLEFLGDSIINFIVAKALYQTYPTAMEGDLTRWRAQLVNRETLAELATELEIGQHIHLGSSELKSGAYRRKSILADALEAIAAAILLDGGMEICEKKVLQWYRERIAELANSKPKKDPKTELQEYLQSKRQTLPSYTVVNIQGEPHEQIFNVSCSVQGYGFETKGTGETRRHAEQKAAQKFLEKLNRG